MEWNVTVGYQLSWENMNGMECDSWKGISPCFFQFESNWICFWKNEWGDSATYGRLMHLTAPHFYRFSILMHENDVYLILPRFTSFYLDFSFSVLSVLDLSVYTTIIIYILNWSFCTTNIFVFAKWQIYIQWSPRLSVGWALGHLGTRTILWRSMSGCIDYS